MKQQQPVYWRGKIFGALLGFVLGKGFWVAVVIGFLIGHWVDKVRSRMEEIRRKVYLYQAYYAQQQQQGTTYEHAVYARQKSSIEEAYEILGVDATVSDAALKKAYRRLMSQHHPDKLMAQGASEEEINIAKQKTQAISVAYENIVQDRKEAQ